MYFMNNILRKLHSNKRNNGNNGLKNMPNKLYSKNIRLLMLKNSFFLGELTKNKIFNRNGSGIRI